jgi:predicted nucleic acid-binding protein
MARVEVARIRDADRRRKVRSLLPPKKRIMPRSDTILDLARDLRSAGLGLADAVHLAAARDTQVDVFLTVDDKLLGRGRLLAARLGISIMSPGQFLREYHANFDW